MKAPYDLASEAAAADVVLTIDEWEARTMSLSLDEWIGATHDLAEWLPTPERQMWIRATVYVTEGHWGENTKSDLVLTALRQGTTNQWIPA